MQALLLGSPAQPQKVWIIKSVQVQEGEKYNPTLPHSRCQDLWIWRVKSIYRSSLAILYINWYPSSWGCVLQPSKALESPLKPQLIWPQPPAPVNSLLRSCCQPPRQKPWGERDAPPRLARIPGPVPTAKQIWKLITAVLCFWGLNRTGHSVADRGRQQSLRAQCPFHSPAPNPKCWLCNTAALHRPRKGRYIN